ncbi:uncharacterized protein [Panulirus ornatus]|uniref:uncharacterized protein n=1 Tax=Panulirus ornatus TaxID=150431 RepID=UPI003A8AB116
MLFKRVTRPPYGALYKEFLLKSDNKMFRKLGQLILIGPSIMEGLQQALEHNQAVIDSRRYLEHLIAENFTRQDGSTDLYIGQEHVMPVSAAWLIPHDAPYQTNFDRCMMAVIEAGLYGKWSKEQKVKARLNSSRRKREYLAQQQQQKEQEGTGGGTQSGSSTTALTLAHMQGPLMLLLLGLASAGFIFSVEVFKDMLL